MFDMFRGGKMDVVTLMAVDYEWRKSELDRIVSFIRKNYSCGQIDVEDICAECDIDNLTEDEINYIEQQLNK